jgi:hypothetical protein
MAWLYAVNTFNYPRDIRVDRYSAFGSEGTFHHPG